MTELDDQQLLREFAETNSESAFATLVERYVNLVHSTTLRFTSNPHHAEEITQAVFIILARKAGKISPRVVLSGWLYQAARLTAANFLKSERRRQSREQEVYMQTILNEPDANSWKQIAPLLDEAMGKLGEADRNAVVLRFFENKTAAEIAAKLKMSEAAAHKRVNRALEKLRKIFTKRGANSTTAILAETISANSIQAAPVGLAKTISVVAIAKGSIAAASTITLVKATMKTMTWMKIKFAIGIGLAIILTAGTTTALIAQRQVQTHAAIPYKMVDDFNQLLASVDQTKFIVHGTLSSKIGIASTNIHLVIQSAVKGPIPLQLGTNGQILNFPNDETLRRENPLILSDQPRGTLNFTLTSELPVPDNLTFNYNQLVDGLAEANKAIAKANQMIKADKLPPFIAGKPQGVIFKFAEASAGTATVEIISATGKQEYVADDDGQIKLKVEENRSTENLKIKVSEKPQKIALDWE